LTFDICLLRAFDDIYNPRIGHDPDLTNTSTMGSSNYDYYSPPFSTPKNTPEGSVTESPKFIESIPLTNASTLTIRKWLSNWFDEHSLGFNRTGHEECIDWVYWNGSDIRELDIATMKDDLVSWGLHPCYAADISRGIASAREFEVSFDHFLCRSKTDTHIEETITGSRPWSVRRLPGEAA
jgi:hypothetical protein